MALDFQTLTGLEYLKADIACKHDKAMEKEHWNTRIAHFDSLDLTDPTLFKFASNPIGLRAGILALNDTLNKTPSGYMVSLDAASSGMQLLSLLVSCPTSFKLCGGDPSILDSYVEIYKSMEIGKGISRKDVKKAIMTALYGSTEGPERVFGKDVELFYETMETMAPGAWDLNQSLQDLWNHVKGNTYDWTMPDGFFACIETNDTEVVPFTVLGERMEVIQKVQQRPWFHKGLGPNLIHSIDGMIVREMLRRCMFDEKVTVRVMNLIMKTSVRSNDTDEGGQYHTEMVEKLWDLYKKSGFLSVRILEHLYLDNIHLVDDVVIGKLIQSLPQASFQVVTVHDCFRCHPNYGNDLRRQYNQILCDIKNSDMLKFLASQVVGRKVNIKKIGKIDDDVILNANYTLG